MTDHTQREQMNILIKLINAWLAVILGVIFLFTGDIKSMGCALWCLIVYLNFDKFGS